MDTKERLKNEIITYLVKAGVSDKNSMAKAFDVIKEASYRVIEFDANMQCEYPALSINVGGEFYYRIAQSFSACHYEAVSNFSRRYAAIQDAIAQAKSDAAAIKAREITPDNVLSYR